MSQKSDRHGNQKTSTHIRGHLSVPYFPVNLYKVYREALINKTINIVLKTLLSKLLEKQIRNNYKKN